MNGEGPSSRRRIVVLSRDPAFAGTDQAVGPDGQVVRVGSGYEAAAEILIAAPAALVIDLRALGRHHLGLLDLARQAGVEMLLAGTIPAGLGTDVLSGARLLAQAELADAMRAILSGEIGQPVEAPPVEPAARVELRPAKRAAAKAEAPPEAPGAHQPAQGRRRSLHEEAMLTPEELAALLGDQP